MSKVHKTFDVQHSKNAYELIYKEPIINPLVNRNETCGNGLPDNTEANILEQANISARQIIDAAEMTAREIISNAKIEAEDISEQIKGSANSEGYNDGISKAEAEYAEKISALQDSLHEISALKQTLLLELEPQIVKLCIEISEKYLKQQITADNKSFIPVITDAIKKVSKAESITVHLSMEHYKNADDIKQAIAREIGRIKAIEFKVDEFLACSDCLVETELGIIDGGINTYIENVSQAFELERYAGVG